MFNEKSQQAEKFQVEIDIIGADKKDWYVDLVGLPMKAFIFRKGSRNAVSMSMAYLGLLLEIKDEHFKVRKGFKDIRQK